jgi:hypothetical protein
MIRKVGNSLDNRYSMPGMKLTTAAYKGEVWSPKWDDNTRLETHIRPVGPMNKEGTDFLPWRYSGEVNDVGQWLMSYPLFRGGTSELTTFVAALQDPKSPGDILDTNEHPSPAHCFVNAAKTMCNNDTSKRWKAILMDGKSGKGAALPKRIGSWGFIQGILLQHGNTAKISYKSPRWPVMLMMSPSALTAVLDVLNTEKEGYVGDPEDYNARFACGDVIGVTTGSILSLFNGRTEKTTTDAGGGVDWSKTGVKTGHRTVTELAYYKCEVVKRLQLPKNANGVISLPGAENKQLFTPWEKAIRLLSEAEMVDALCKAYSDVPELLRFCLKPYYQYLPAFVKGDVAVTVPERSAVPEAQAPTAPQATQAAAAPAADDASEDVDWAGAQNEAPADITPDNVGEVMQAGVTAAAATASSGAQKSSDPAIAAALAALQASRKAANGAAG